jgi:hypothetical protein
MEMSYIDIRLEVKDINTYPEIVGATHLGSDLFLDQLQVLQEHAGDSDSFHTETVWDIIEAFTPEGA